MPPLYIRTLRHASQWAPAAHRSTIPAPRSALAAPGPLRREP